MSGMAVLPLGLMFSRFSTFASDGALESYVFFLNPQPQISTTRLAGLGIRSFRVSDFVIFAKCAVRLGLCDGWLSGALLSRWGIFYKFCRLFAQS